MIEISETAIMLIFILSVAFNILLLLIISDLKLIIRSSNKIIEDYEVLIPCLNRRIERLERR